MRARNLLTFCLICQLLAGCASREGKNDGKGPAVDPKVAAAEPAAREFSGKLAAGDGAGAYAMFASFTRQAVSAQEWQSSFQEYWEGFGKPNVIDLTMEPFDDDPDWRSMRGIPTTFPATAIKAEATLYLDHPEGIEKEGFYVSFVVVEEAGRLVIASPYLED